MELRLDQLSVMLDGRMLIRPVTLSAGPGEIVTLMGPSGSGKSSILSAIAGDLGPPFSVTGQVRLGEADLSHLPPERRSIGRLFQDDLLFPHLTVSENLLFGMPRGARGERMGRAERALADAGLKGLGDRPPHTLSGGQRARVALLRALLAEPRAMLLDEPFSRLDAELKSQIRDVVFTNVMTRGIPCLLVTHDRADAPAGGLIYRITREGDVVRD